MTSNMAKITYDDKLRIQTLHEQGYGAKRIKNAYPTSSGHCLLLVEFVEELNREVLQPRER